MAKAKRKSTVDQAIGKANDVRARFLEAELAEPLRRFAQSPTALAIQQWLSTARSKKAERDRVSEAIDRALAIKAGYIPPPWMKQPATSPRRTGNNWRRNPIEEVVRELRAGDDLREAMPPHEQLRLLGNELERRGIPGSPTTQRRALGFRKN